MNLVRPTNFLFDPAAVSARNLGDSRPVAAGCMVVWLIAVLGFSPTVFADDSPGAKIYRQKCVRCHGEAGEGSDDFPLPLAGTRSIEQLARFIAKSMPKGAPGTCAGYDAQAVAAFIFDAFYSPIAQARNKPARVELSRLTVRQYRNSVADLVGSFRPAVPLDEQHGLRGEYFKSRRFRDGDRVLTRRDQEIAFDFGNDGPEPEKFDPHQFSIRWEGSVVAPDTGNYEFIVRTEHAVRLHLNDMKQPLIDAWVKSGNDNEYHAPLFLVGGRAYPLRLEFSKAKQGVDDSDKQKDKPAVHASISLEWARPGLPAQVIPSRQLVPQRVPESFVVTTPFPPDDRSAGYERGTSISKAWDESTTEAAIEVAGYVAARVRELSGVRDDAADRAARLRQFCIEFAERAFRRPLTDDQRQFYINRRFDGAPDLDTAVKRVVLLVLKSPRFLYREMGADAGGPAESATVRATAAAKSSEATKLDGYDVAARLSFGLWDSLPDETLLKAAAAGELQTREQIERQARRMLGDARTRSKLHEFWLRWLKVENVPDLAKDRERFPGFDSQVAADLRTSLELFLDRVVWSESSDFRDILLADGLFLNGRLARFYGAELADDAPFQMVTIEPDARAGVLTHPYLMSAFAYTGSSSPIHRGVFLARSVLGRPLKPPPEAFTPLPAELHPNLTTRERVLLQTKPEACTKCHGMINPLGFSLESFDAVGRFRDSENGKPIDTTGEYESRTGDAVTFRGVRELARYLADSDEVHAAFVEQLFQYLIKQPVRAYGADVLTDLQESFATTKFNLRELVVQIVGDSTGISEPTRKKSEL